jgi:hypothetical protein
VSTPDADPRPYGRRAFLGLLAGGLTSFAWALPASRIFSPVTSGLSQLVADVLPVGGWRIYTISGSMPVFDPKVWRLEIAGLVKRPLSLSYDDLLSLPRSEQVSTFHCVTGWTVKDVHWAGVRFKHLLALAEPAPEARAIRYVSLEQPYTDSLTLQQATLRPPLPVADQPEDEALAERDHTRLGRGGLGAGAPREVGGTGA